MVNDTLTFVLGGQLEIAEFLRGIRLFHNLVRDLTKGKQVKWVVEELHSGSATTTLRGEAEDLAEVEAVVGVYGGVGNALEHRQDLDFGPDVNRSAAEIKRFAGSVDYIRFQVPENDYTVQGNAVARARRPLAVSLGAVSGRVQTLSNRSSLRFVLFDSVHDQAVPCYLQPGQEDLMLEAWDRRARVSGSVTRDPDSFRPIALRHISEVEILEDVAPGSYRRARGAVPWQSGNKMPEDVVRQLRDA